MCLPRCSCQPSEDSPGCSLQQQRRHFLRLHLHPSCLPSLRCPGGSRSLWAAVSGMQGRTAHRGSGIPPGSLHQHKHTEVETAGSSSSKNVGAARQMEASCSTGHSDV